MVFTILEHLRLFFEGLALYISEISVPPQLKGEQHILQNQIGKGKDSIMKMLPLLSPIQLKSHGAGGKPFEAEA